MGGTAAADHRGAPARPDKLVGMHSALPDRLSSLPLDHVAIAVTDLDGATAPYRLLGLEVLEDSVLEEQGVRVRMLSAGDSKVELLEPLDAQSPVGRFLEKRGAGLHHIALGVNDIEAEVERLRTAGARFTSDGPRPGHGGTSVIFLHPSWTGGVLVELVEQPGADRAGE